jgi:transketolase
MTATVTEDLRSRFYRLLPELLAEEPRAVAVFGEVGVGYLDEAGVAPVADRVVNVGIREQLVIGVTGGLALTGLRPIAHTFGPFLVERPFEQVKLDLGHQDVGAVLVSAGGSYDWPEGGETHFGYRDVAVLDTLDGWTVHVPGHPDEAETLLRAALREEGRVYLRLGVDMNAEARPTGPMAVLRRGSRGTVVAVGPMADRTLAAVADLDVTVLYATTVRPFDTATLRATVDEPAVVLVEPYLRDTSTAVVTRALADRPHRVLGLGVGPAELRAYGSRADHDARHGLDERGIRSRITEFLG